MALWLTYRDGIDRLQHQELKAKLRTKRYWGERRAARDWLRRAVADSYLIFHAEPPKASEEADSEPEEI